MKKTNILKDLILLKKIEIYLKDPKSISEKEKILEHNTEIQKLPTYSYFNKNFTKKCLNASTPSNKHLLSFEKVTNSYTLLFPGYFPGYKAIALYTKILFPL